MRVISGTARGTKLLSLEGLNTRPTLDRVKEALFNILQFEIKDAKVLDLFSGSGALGIEALSRGAALAVFADNSKDAVKIITQNIENTRLSKNAEVIKDDYQSVLDKLKKENKQFDIIFLDPPYKEDFALKALEKIIKYNLLTKDGIVILETNDANKNHELLSVNGIEIFDERKYGRVILIFIRKE